MDQFCAQYRRVRVEDDAVPFLKELGENRDLQCIKDVFFVVYRGLCHKSRECLFLALRNFTEELLFKHVLKQKHELPAGQEQKGIRGGDSLSKDQEGI